MAHLSPLFASPIFWAALALGALLLVLLLVRLRSKTRHTLLQETMRQAEEQRSREIEAILERVKDAFGNLSLEVLARNNEAFLQLARESLAQHTQAASSELEGKRQLIAN